MVWSQSISIKTAQLIMRVTLQIAKTIAQLIYKLGLQLGIEYKNTYW